MTPFHIVGAEEARARYKHLNAVPSLLAFQIKWHFLCFQSKQTNCFLQLESNHFLLFSPKERQKHESKLWNVSRNFNDILAIKNRIFFYFPIYLIDFNSYLTNLLLPKNWQSSSISIARVDTKPNWRKSFHRCFKISNVFVWIWLSLLLLMETWPSLSVLILLSGLI